MLENHSSSWARPSSGSSTKSASGFSSKIRENCLLSLDQFVIVGVIFRKILNPTCIYVSPLPIHHTCQVHYLGNHLGNFAEVGTGWHTRLGQKVFNQSYANVVAHSIQLLVDIGVVVLVIFAQLRNNRAICEGDKLGADLVYARPRAVRSCQSRFCVRDLLPYSDGN